MADYSRVCDGATCDFAGVSKVCVPVGCYEAPAYTTTDGLHAVSFKYHDGEREVTTNTSVPAGVIPAAQGPHSFLEVICPTGYRAHGAEPAPPDPGKKTFRHTHCAPAHDNTTRFPVVNCSRLTCGNFSMPNMSATGLRGVADSFGRASLQQNILYHENVTVTCDANHRIHGAACSVRSFSLMCGDDGTLRYKLSDGTISESVPQCVPIVCHVAQLAVLNGVKKETGELMAGESVNVTCNAGYLKQSSALFPTRFPTCGADSSFLVECQDAACGFDPAPPHCRPVGCLGLGSHQVATNDSLFNLTFRHAGIAYPAANMSMDGMVQAGDNAALEVHCPPGYRVHPDMEPPHPTASQDTFKAVGCPVETCELPVVRCVRLTCVSTALPKDATGTRFDTLVDGSTAVSLDDGANITHLLYGEKVTVACDSTYRLPSSGVCSSTGQAFAYSCEDVDEAEDVPVDFVNLEYDTNYTTSPYASDTNSSASLYVGDESMAFFSSTPPHQLGCTPITCDVNADTVNSEFATTMPASGGGVRSSTTANVTCEGDEEGETSKYLVRGANSTRRPVSAPSRHR